MHFRTTFAAANLTASSSSPQILTDLSTSLMAFFLAGRKDDVLPLRFCHLLLVDLAAFLTGRFFTIGASFVKCQ